MRIPAIQNYYRTNNTYSNNQKINAVQTSKPQNVVNMSVPKMNTSSKVNFAGLQYSPLAIVKKFPLEDRLADLFKISTAGDMIIAGKDLKTAQKVLKESVRDLGHVIKRFFFVPEDGIEGAAIFTRTPQDTLEAFNPNKANMYLRETSGNKTPIKTGESFYVVAGDVVEIGNKRIRIKTAPKTDLSVSRPIFSQVFDKSKEAKQAIESANTKSVSSLFNNVKAGERTITFADIGGQDGVIKDLKKGILYPIKYPEAYKNSIVNHGFLMYGPPGTGKTLIAQALANETKSNFIKLNGLEMESKWVGESEKNWRELFDAARENQPSIIFIDEFDAVAKKRGGADVFGDKVVNQILTLMSDVEKNGDDIYVVAATNNQNALDAAITRSGRFGKHIEVKAPDTQEAITQIFNIHTKNKALADDLDKDALTKKLLAQKTTGADIAHIVNTAHENAFERAGIYEKMENGTFENADIENLRITDADFNKAIDGFTNKENKRQPIGFNK